MSAPTRHNEAWRYSDIAAVEAAWPLPAPESIIVPAGGTFARTIIQDSGTIHQLDIAIGKVATAAIHVLNIGGDYGRVEINVTLHEGADFKLGAVQIGGARKRLRSSPPLPMQNPARHHRRLSAPSWRVRRPAPISAK